MGAVRSQNIFVLITLPTLDTRVPPSKKHWILDVHVTPCVKQTHFPTTPPQRNSDNVPKKHPKFIGGHWGGPTWVPGIPSKLGSTTLIP